MGGGGNSLKFRVKSEEVRVGGSSSSWRFGKRELGRGKRNSSLFNLHCSLSVLLAGVFALAANGVYAANERFVWKGKSAPATSSWGDKSCWYYHNGSSWRASDPASAPDSYTYPVYFRDGYTLSNVAKNFAEGWDHVVTFSGKQRNKGHVYVDAGTTEDNPIVFTATADDNGLDLTSSGKNLVVGFETADGYLKLTRGTYKVNMLQIGSGSPILRGVLILDAANEDLVSLIVNGSSDGLLVHKGSVTVANRATLESAGDVRIKDGAVYVKQGGKMTLSTWCAVGYLANTTGRLEIDGGEVESTANRMTIGDVDNSTGIVVIKNDGKYSNIGSSGVGITVGQQESGTLEVDDGEVDLGERTFQVCNTGSSTAIVTIKNGGIVKMKGIVCGSGTGGATITIDGGILKATVAEATLVPANNNLTVTVGSNGGTIDNGRYNVIINSAIGGTGGMTFTGGGTTTLNGAVTYEGATTIEVGTAVVVASADNIGGGLVLTVPATAPADGVYTVLSVSGDETLEGFTLPDAPEKCSLRLSADNKSILCIYGSPQNTWIGGESGTLSDNTGWSFGLVPRSGDSCVINNATAARLTVGDTFAPSAITFPSGSAAVTIDGRDLTGIAAITNLSSASHTINAKVYFTSGINVKQDASSYNYISQSHVTFTGGAYAESGKTIDDGYSVAMFGKYYFANTSEWTATEEGNSRMALADNSELYVPKSGNTINLYIGNGAKVNVANTSLSTGRLSYKNYGEMVVTNLTLGSFSSDLFLTWNQGVSNPSVFRFNSVTNTSNSNRFLYFADGSVATKTTLYFGAGGVGFSGLGLTSTTRFAFGKDVDNNQTTIRPWDSDFTIGGKSNTDNGIRFGKRVIFNTDDDSDEGHTITLAAKYYGGTGASVDVGGSGTLLVTGQNTGGNALPMTVTGTATLAVGAGGSLGTSAVTLNAGTTFALTAAGREFTAFANALKLPTEGAAKIRIEGKRLLHGEHVIASNVTGGSENVKLDGESAALAGRKATLRVEGGKLYLTIKPDGTMIIVR